MAETTAARQDNRDRPARVTPGPLYGMRLTNLRRFEDTGRIGLSSFNFVFGKNSSGKTTILRAPLLLRQLMVAQSVTGEVPLSGPYVDFGSYGDAVHDGAKSRDIGLTYDLHLGDALTRYTGRRRSNAGSTNCKTFD